MFKLLATRQIELNQKITDLPTALNVTQIFYKMLDVNKTIRTYVNTILDPNIATQHHAHEEEFNTHRLLAVCTDTWYLIACIIGHEKMEEHLSDFLH